LIRLDQATEDLCATRDVNVAEDRFRGLGRIFGAEDHEQDLRWDRPTGVDRIGRGCQPSELACQRRQVDVTRAIDHKTHGAVGPVVQQQHDRLREVRVFHLATSDQEFPGRGRGIDRCDDARRADTDPYQADEEQQKRAVNCAHRTPTG
jgi:hypothetical protein